eukprot:TRINITY_DN3517_c0_g1_i2.p1 TRINITY_DN3517_c0_g1~~TRINITY_DN3517_c0_g1_i2.p1  ORF type:complete len:265 (-),score=45.10 TRINITY_DN3517_c0_g1_i2:341-1135(-)
MLTTPSGIQGHLLEVTVVGCNKLKNTEWISRQDPYVCLEYANTKFRTRTCTDGGKNPTFREKFVFSLIEGLRELNVNVWNSNSLTQDDFIGSTRVQLQKVLSQGYDDTPWSLQSKSGRSAGEVRLILHYANANSSAIPAPGYAPTAPPYGAPVASHAPMYSTLPPPSSPYMPAASYLPSPFPSYPPPPANPAAYPPSPYSPALQPTAYPPKPLPSAYHPQPLPNAYPLLPYPPAPYPPLTYPHAPQGSPYYPPGHYPGTYPPPY